MKTKNRKKTLLWTIIILAGLISGLVLFIVCKLFWPYQKYDNKISVIMPVYNVADYLEKSLDSVTSQKHKNVEIICVNDGSTDNSLEILKNYREKDDRIIIIDQPNGGVSSARNAGMRASAGEYLAFVDPDDIVDPEIFTKSLNVAIRNNADIVTYNLNIFPEEIGRKQKIKNYLKDIYNKAFKYHQDVYVNNSFKPALDFDNVITSMCCKLIKRSLVMDNEIFLKENLSYAEDLLFRLMIFPRAKIIVSIPDRFYHYRVSVVGSLSKAKAEKRLASAMICADYLIDDWLAQGYTKQKQWLLSYTLEAVDRMLDVYKDNPLKIISCSEEILKIAENKLLPLMDEQSLPEEITYKLKILREYAKLQEKLAI